MQNTFGTIFRLTTFGESHGSGIGGVIDGCPSGIYIDRQLVQNELARRRPGQSSITTQRAEADEVEFLSGLFDGKTTGTPIGFLVRNADHHSSDYDNLRQQFRPSHADYTYQVKYGIRDHRGGGRSSARETIARVVGGAIAKQILAGLGIKICAYTSQVGDVCVTKTYRELDLSQIDQTIVRCPDLETADRMIRLIEQVKKEGDTIGGIITGVITGVPAGLGEPVFGKLHATLGAAMLGINAVKGFEYGDGFDVSHRGSQSNDLFEMEDGKVHTITNHSGGIQGGISNGEDIYFKVAFKPVATLLQPQETIDMAGEKVTLQVRGRHDPCVLPRAVPIVEAMAAMTILDYYLMNKHTRLDNLQG